MVTKQLAAFLIILALLITLAVIAQKNPGAAKFPTHCGNGSSTSTCFCNANEAKVIINDTNKSFICEVKVE